MPREGGRDQKKAKEIALSVKNGVFFCIAAVFHYLCIMKLSIIIPVYRVEATLARCVDSVRGQSFTDYEMILVDDGSPDRSGAMCDEYAAEDSRIIVIHKQNGGLSSARNRGLDRAQGEYVTFLDSDDFLGDDTLAILMSRLGAHPDYDILEYPVYWHYGGMDQRIQKFGVKEYSDMRAYWLDCKAYTHTYACNKVYRRQLFDHVRFPEGVLYEDAHTLPRLLQHAHLVATTEEGLYYYTSNPDGITMRGDGKGLTDLLEAHVAQLDHLGIGHELTEYYCHVLNIQLDVYGATRQPPILAKPSFTSHDISPLQVGHKTKVKLRMLKLLGIKNLCKLHTLLHPHRGAR